MPMLVTADGGGGGRQSTGKVWLGWDPNHPSQEKLEPLVSSISVPSAPSLGPLPTVGWRCGVDNTAEAVAAGSRLLYAGGEAEVESAIGAAVESLDGDARATVRIITSLDDETCAGGPDAARAACEATIERLGGMPIDILVSAPPCRCTFSRSTAMTCLRACLSTPCACLLVACTQLLSEASWGVAADLLESGVCQAVGLSVSDVALCVPALQNTLLAGGAQPAVLVTVLHPLVPLVQRMLLGLCRRKGVRVFALEPLGGAMADGVQAATAAATEKAATALGMIAGEEEGADQPKTPSQEWESEATSVLLGWSIARDVIALPGSSDGCAATELVPLAAALPPMPLAVRRALDELAPPNGTAVGFGPGKWVPPDHLKDRYEVFKGDSNWNRTEQ